MTATILWELSGWRLVEAEADCDGKGWDAAKPGWRLHFEWRNGFDATGAPRWMPLDEEGSQWRHLAFAMARSRAGGKE